MGRSQVSPSLTPLTTSSFPLSVFRMLLSVFLFPTSTTSRELVKLFAELSNKELYDLETKLDSCHQTSRVRRFSPLNSTRRFSTRLDQVTPSVCPSRVLPRTKRSLLVTSSTTKRMVNSSQSRLSPLWLLSKNTLVFSSPVTALLSSPVPQRLLARWPRSCGKWERRPEVPRSTTPQNFHSSKTPKSNLSLLLLSSSNLSRNAPLLGDLPLWTRTD